MRHPACVEDSLALQVASKPALAAQSYLERSGKLHFSRCDLASAQSNAELNLCMADHWRAWASVMANAQLLLQACTCPPGHTIVLWEAPNHAHGILQAAQRPDSSGNPFSIGCHCSFHTFLRSAGGLRSSFFSPLPVFAFLLASGTAWPCCLLLRFLARLSFLLFFFPFCSPLLGWLAAGLGASVVALFSSSSPDSASSLLDSSSDSFTVGSAAGVLLGSRACNFLFAMSFSFASRSARCRSCLVFPACSKSAFCSQPKDLAHTDQAMLDDSASSLLVQTQVCSWLYRTLFSSADFLEVLLHPCQFLKDGMIFRFDSIES
jgi:hypothetical protein